MAKLNQLLFIMTAVLALGITTYAATSSTISISADVVNVEEMQVKSTQIPASLSDIMPYGSVSTDIHSPAWKVAAPIAITLAVTNNITARKLVVYTNHRVANYWHNAAATLPVSTQVNGLVNTMGIMPDNISNTTVALKAFADIAHEGAPTTNNSAWVDVIDISSGISPNSAGILYQGEIIDPTITIYIKQAWPSGKLAGSYSGKILFELVNQ